MNVELIRKYNVAGPRYTSYPTVPYWDAETFDADAWEAEVQMSAADTPEDGISLYIHLPYCESLCTFCGCNKRITKNHDVEQPYIQAVLREWAMYRDLMAMSMGKRPMIAELHLGGGTPSFFSPKNLHTLLAGIFADAVPTKNAVFGFEGHPNNTTEEHLRTLYALGFRRVSFGVQEYDAEVQKAIHRIQPVENVARVTELARSIGYTSISHDLVFGLPFQKVSHIENTIAQTVAMKPDRIAFYSYAHVPWIKGNGQRGFNDEDLPTAAEKRALYETGRAQLEAAGYVEIGMDHFALPHDSLYTAMENGSLHRNFMGYTTAPTRLMLGLGVSAIGDTWTAFAQNEKDIDAYLNAIAENRLPLLRGHLLSDEDLHVREIILDIMCRFRAEWHPADWTFEEWRDIRAALEGFAADGLLTFDERSLTVLPAGRPFVRNICMAFDMRLRRAQPTERTFSQTV